MARLNCPEAAAKLAGYSPAKSAELLGDSRVKRLIKRLRSRKAEEIAEIAALGLERVIFSPTDGALSLLQNDGEISPAQSADLFAVSEIKKQKGGGIEIKFYDKVKAAALLADIASSMAEIGQPDKKDGSFLAALEKSASTAVEPPPECETGEI